MKCALNKLLWQWCDHDNIVAFLSKTLIYEHWKSCLFLGQSLNLNARFVKRARKAMKIMPHFYQFLCWYCAMKICPCGLAKPGWMGITEPIKNWLLHQSCSHLHLDINILLVMLMGVPASMTCCMTFHTILCIILPRILHKISEIMFYHLSHDLLQSLVHSMLQGFLHGMLHTWHA